MSQLSVGASDDESGACLTSSPSLLASLSKENAESWYSGAGFPCRLTWQFAYTGKPIPGVTRRWLLPPWPPPSDA